MEAIIGICDMSAGYSNHLAAYINSRRDMGFRAIAFSNTASIYEFLQSRPLGLLLSDDPEHPVLFGNRIKVRMLTDDPEECEEWLGEASPIFKYKKASEILKAAIPENREGQNSRKIHVVYSPGACKKGLGVAEALATRLSNEDRTLFIPWDAFCAVGTNGERAKGITVSELLFAIRQNPVGLAALFKNLPMEKGFEYLSRADFYTDLWQFSPEEMEQLVVLCREQGKYENLVFFCGFISPGVERLMEVCDELWLVKDEEPLAEDVFSKEFIRQMRFGGRTDIIAHLREI